MRGFILCFCAYFGIMAARDKYHDVVRHALEKVQLTLQEIDLKLVVFDLPSETIHLWKS